MDNKNLKSILQDELEKEISTAQIDLWPAVKQHLVARKHPLFQQGEKMNTTRSRRLPRTAFVILTIVVLLVAAFLTPQGQAWAQSVLQYFTRAETDVLPLQPWQMTPLPTPAPETTQEPFALTVKEAEALAGYKVFVPTEIRGHNFYGAEYNPDAGSVSINFSDPEIGFGNGFLITEQLLKSPQDIYPLDGVVGASAPVETVQIGSLSGEYVMGVWNLTDNGPVWIAEPSLQTLRWKTDTMFFELVYMGSKLTKEDLIAIAESIQ